MARRIHYRYHGQEKLINFSNDRFNSLQEAVAAAEGVDLTRYLAMEHQVSMTSKGKHAMREFRDSEFERMGFSDIRFEKD
jgi:hypothetical protein